MAAALNGDDAAALIQADMRDPAPCWTPRAARLIDFSQPVGLLVTAVLHFVADGSTRRLWPLPGPLAPGSYLALSHATRERIPPMRYSAGQVVHSRRRCLTCDPGPRSAGFRRAPDLSPRTTGPAPSDLTSGCGAARTRAGRQEGSRWLYCGVARKP